MSSLYFLAMLIGVAWLAVWSALPRPWRGGGWWPFDMREADEGRPAEDASREGAGPAPWQRRIPSRVRR